MCRNLKLKFQIQIELWVCVPVTIGVEWDLQFHALSSGAEAPKYIIVLFLDFTFLGGGNLQQYNFSSNLHHLPFPQDIESIKFHTVDKSLQLGGYS